MSLGYRVGDATLPPARPAVILHVVNDVGAWGAGFTAALDRRWSAAGADYRAWYAALTGPGDGRRAPCTLGFARLVRLTEAPNARSIWLAHLCAQEGLPGGDRPPPFRPAAFRDALRRLRPRLATLQKQIGAGRGLGDPDAAGAGLTLHAPRLGCGLGGGRWSDVEAALRIVTADWPLFIYDLPVTGRVAGGG